MVMVMAMVMGMVMVMMVMVMVMVMVSAKVSARGREGHRYRRGHSKAWPSQRKMELRRPLWAFKLALASSKKW